MSAVIARGVGRSFDGREIYADIDLDIDRNEFVALLGRSGTGKSTLLRALGGLDPEYDGSVLVPDARSVVFQEPRLLPWRRVRAQRPARPAPQRPHAAAGRRRARRGRARRPRRRLAGHAVGR